MNKAAKRILLPAYYRFLRAGRKFGFLREARTKICISSTKKYAGETVPPLTASLLQNGIAPADIYVFEGGHTARHTASTNFIIIK